MSPEIPSPHGSSQQLVESQFVREPGFKLGLCCGRHFPEQVLAFFEEFVPAPLRFDVVEYQPGKAILFGIVEFLELLPSLGCEFRHPEQNTTATLAHHP